MNIAKIRKFIRGRRGQFARIEKACAGVDHIVWVHAASYGEFEEARPIIAQIRLAHPEVRILATFFSPSGYEYLKNDSIADWVFYLPIDTKPNAKRFLDIVRPERVIISISDYWLNFLHELRRREIPVFLTSARFLPQMRYFKPVGKPWLKAIKTCFTNIIVNDESSKLVLESNGVCNVLLSGDPRMDRVVELAAKEWNDPLVDAWARGAKPFIAGSTLPDEDDESMIELANANPDDKFIIVPHEIGGEQTKNLRSSIKGGTVLYTELQNGVSSDAQVLIIDIVGILSRLYRYGFAAFIGAGFSGGAPHSVIEPAAYGIPVFFGPNFGPQLHCAKLVAAGAAAAVHSPAEMLEWYGKLKTDRAVLEKMGTAALDYCRKGSGVAKAIADIVMA